MNTEAIDGFLLGDGCVTIDRRMKREAARLTCSQEHKEFATYLMAQFETTTDVSQYDQDSMSSGVVWIGRSNYEDALFKQRQRWYPTESGKQPPDDVAITPLSVMMWYLGDGSVVNNTDANTIMLRLSTDGFTAERVEFLARRLKEVAAVACHRNGDNRIMVEARGVPAFFNFIGHVSPVRCYDYKFDLPSWRMESKRMKEVADELGVNYNRLAHLVKIGKVPCLRLTPKGKPRFLPEHVRYVESNAEKLFV